MAVTTSRLVGTGKDYETAVKNLVSQMPSEGEHQFKYINFDESVGPAMCIGFSPSPGIFWNFVPTKKQTGDTYKAILNLAESANGLFLYQDDGTAIMCVVTMSDGTEFMYRYAHSTLTEILKSDNGGALHKVYIPASDASGYVIMCPIIYQDTSIGKVGADSGDVLFVEGISNSVWSPNGVKINGHTYYGCGKYCTRAD